MYREFPPESSLVTYLNEDFASINLYTITIWLNIVKQKEIMTCFWFCAILLALSVGSEIYGQMLLSRKECPDFAEYGMSHLHFNMYLIIIQLKTFRKTNYTNRTKKLWDFKIAAYIQV